MKRIIAFCLYIYEWIRVICRLAMGYDIEEGYWGKDSIWMGDVPEPHNHDGDDYL